MKQQKPAIYEIEAILGKSGHTRVGPHKLRIVQTIHGAELPRLFELGRMQIDPGDASRRPDQGCEHPSHCARAATEVRNPHALCEPRLEKRLATRGGIYLCEVR